MINTSKLSKIEVESVFDIESAINFIVELKTKELFLSDSFFSNTWIFPHEYSPGRSIKLDFKKISVNLTYNEELIIRCWVVSLLKEHRPSTTLYYFYHFSLAVNVTNYFSLDKTNYFNDWLHEKQISDNRKIYIVSNVLSFFEFSEHENSSDYISILYILRNKLKYDNSPIKLPSSKYILLFSYYLEKYFIDIENKDLFSSEEMKNKKILFYPILIWWKLTTIIPMRSTEFCLIKSNCLSVENNKYFIEICRIKRPTNTLRDDYNKIEINEEIYNFLSEYIEMTKEFGRSDTLISYRSIMNVDSYDIRNSQKIDLSSFNKNNFEKLLIRFYKEVIYKYYQINTSLEQRLSPNDTRHIAFVSLMMQGVSPVEIARIGGHKTIAAQYHYSFHTEYWIDNEVFKLINNYKNKINYDENSTNYIPDSIKLKAFQPPTSDFKGIMDIGYCSDSLIRCEASECMLCSHWRVTLNELNSKRDLIIQKIQRGHNNVSELMNFVYKIHTNTILKVTSLTHLEDEKRLQQSLISIKSELENLSQLVQIEGTVH